MVDGNLLKGAQAGETRGEYQERVAPMGDADRLLMGRIRTMAPTSEHTEAANEFRALHRLQHRVWSQLQGHTALQEQLERILRHGKATGLTANETATRINEAIRLEESVTRLKLDDDDLVALITELRRC